MEGTEETVPRWVANGSLVLLGLVVATGVAELGVRGLTLALGREPLLVSDDVTGWRLRPNLQRLRAYRNGGYRTSTDAHGHRRTRPPGVSLILAERARQIILVGDSFAQGLGVEDEDTVGWVLSEATRRPVANLGVLGFGTGQSLLAFERYLEGEPGRVAIDVVMLAFENDFVEVQQPFAPFIGRCRPTFQIEGTTLRANPFKPCLRDRLMDLSQVHWLVASQLAVLFPSAQPPAVDGIELVLGCLTRMRAVAAARGARLHIVAHRYRSAGALDDPSWERFVRRAGALDITARLRDGGGSDLVGFDGLHWNAAGHRLVAQILAGLVER